MTKPLWLLALVLLLSAFLMPNPLADVHCTGSAWGMPLPWRIDHCLCEKGRITYNLWAVAGNGALAALLLRRLTRRHNRQAPCP